MPYNSSIKKVLVIGSGPIVIGQAAEFDYSGTQGCLALKEEGIEVVLLNNNPATIMTDQSIADKIYMEPMTLEVLEEIIKKERPDGLIGTLGGQTGLNLLVALSDSGILEKYQVQVLGSPLEAIQDGEDRDRFRKLMKSIDEPIPESKIVHNTNEGMEFAKQIGLPVVVRPAFTLGGEGGGFAEDEQTLQELLESGLLLSPIHQVLVEKSIKGWKEIEYEVIRDANDTCIIVCNMENLDPVGIHTGDSIVVAPSQTLSDEQYQLLRNASLKIIRALGVIGGCNIQFALDPASNHYYIIEVNPRVSRSSALASKATGYPIAKIAVKCAIGYHLDEIINPVTGNTYASFEPALDYIVVKLPRFPFDKFKDADRSLSTQMKATGETMAIDRTFEGALNKGLRSLEIKVFGLKVKGIDDISNEELREHLLNATDLRLFAIAEAIRREINIDEIQQCTKIDFWFLYKIKGMVELEKQLKGYSIENITVTLFEKAKKQNMSDKYISELIGCSEKQVRSKRLDSGMVPSYKLVDTCAGEFDAETPYFYSTYHGFDEVDVSERKKIVIVGSGPIRIGQGIEFDYSSVQAANGFKKFGFETIVINNNPETVSTDFSIADKLYFEPITVEDVLNILHKEQPDGVCLQFGGQTALNLAHELKREGIKIYGTHLETIDRLEDREQFYRFLDELDIPHIKGNVAHHPEMLKGACEELGYPVLIRPSYVIGGQMMKVIHTGEELDNYIQEHGDIEKSSWPFIVDQYLPGLECELDGVSDGKEIYVPGIFEHIEKAGVHSGDSIAVYPGMTISEGTKALLLDYTRKICRTAGIVGVFNIQFVIYEGMIYCLEVNPRASRTVPIITKMTGFPLVEEAVSVLLGRPLRHTGMGKEIPFTAVKMPIFSFHKLKNIDPILGPEMKSTGEIIGLGCTFEEAMRKATIGSQKSKGSSIFCSVADHEKPLFLKLLMEIDMHKDIQIYTSKGTALFLKQNGISSIQVDYSKLVNLYQEKELMGTLVIPTRGHNGDTKGYQFRKLAILFRQPLFDNLDGFFSFIRSRNTQEIFVNTVQEYHNAFKRQGG